MNINTIRTRFAPSPTGYLHIGNARTALFNWFFARHESGKFILRIEDTDRARSTRAFEEAIVEDMRWLGLDWDEGPDTGGSFGPYRQSERFDIYKAYADKLLAQGKAYPCYCTHERLEELRKKQEKAGWSPKYDGRCRTLAKGERSKDIRPVIRFQAPEKIVAFEDKVHKRVSFDVGKFSDFIIIGSDGIAAYNFAVVIDDALMNITHVIRGEDHLSNTPRQILLFEAFGFPVPQYAHTPLILGHDRTPLSKRHGAASVKELREAGFLPEAIVNHLCHLGSAPGKEFMTHKEAIESFSLERLSRSPSLFDIERLKTLNRVCIEKADTKRLVNLAKPYLGQILDLSQEDNGWLKNTVEAVKGEATILKEIPAMLSPLFKEIIFHDDAKKILEEPYAREILKALADEVEKRMVLTSDSYREIMTTMKQRTNISGKWLFLPIRAALTGKTEGLEMEKIFALLGREEVLKRIKKHLA